MKKIYAFAAFVAMLFAVDASAQLSSGIRYGAIGGFTSTNTKLREFDFKNVSLFHAGVAVKFNLPAGFAIQPAFTYQMKGTDLKTIAESPETALDSWKEMKANVGYLEVPLQIQWGPDLMALRPFVFAEPFLGYAVNFNANVFDDAGATVETLKNEWENASLKRLEYGMGFGGGLEVFHFQVSVQWFMNFGGLADENGNVSGKVIGQSIKDNFKSKNFQGIKVSLAVLF